MATPTRQYCLRVVLAGLAAIAAAGPAPAQTPPSSAAPARIANAPSWNEVHIALPLVGSGMAYVPHAPTTRVAVFISGDGGWNQGVVDMARRLATRAIVIGVSYPALRKAAERGSGCWYVAADLELISHAAQKVLHLPQYTPPVLVGYSSGASLVYAALAAAPKVTFAGAVSLGFCPDLEVRRDVCHGDAWDPEYDEKKHDNLLPPTRTLPKPWVALHGLQDQVCSLDTVRRFVKGMPKARLVEIEGTGHGFSKPAHWGAPFDQAAEEIWALAEARPAAAARAPSPPAVTALEDALQALPLAFELRWPANPTAYFVFVSGDGGWASIDEGVSLILAERGIGVVGISSLRYFWQARTPAQVASDLDRIVTVLARSGRPVVAGGYSFGAETVPVALREWTAAERRQLSGVVLIGPGPSASFEIDPLDWFRRAETNPATLVLPAVKALGLPSLCIAGTDEEDSPCTGLTGTRGAQVKRLPGSHHFNGDYAALADAIDRFVQALPVDRRP